MYDETVTVGEIRRRHLEVAAHVLEKVAASGAEWADLDAVERAAVALRQVLDQKRSEEADHVSNAGMSLGEVTEAVYEGYQRGREDAARRLRERVAAYAIAGVASDMVAFYISVEAEHVIAAHPAEDAQSCDSCSIAGSAWLRARRKEQDI